MSVAALPVLDQTAARKLWRLVLRLKLTLLDRRKYERTVLEEIDGLTLVVLPDVFNPKLLRSGAYLVEQLRQHDLLPRGARVLDLGCGSGAAAIAAARHGNAVTAIDINPSAVRCTAANALLNNVTVDVRHGDLFAPVAGERFDVVLFNPPFYRGAPRNALDHAWRGLDVMDRFSEQLGEHLSADGHAVLVLSSDGDVADFLAAFEHHRLSDTVVARRDLVNEVLSIHLVRRC